jgi:hypothetical protein
MVSHILDQCRPAVGGCLEWLGCRHKKGYGCVRFLGRMRKCHHLVFEFHNGLIPAGQHVLHHCDHPWCQNPAHLYTGTNKQNIEDKVSRDRSGKKLNIARARRIKAMIARGHTQARIARLFGIHQCTVAYIKSGRHWAHVQHNGGPGSQDPGN